jgi:hypothetical protein
VNPCEWCRTTARLERDHVAQGTSRKASDGYQELVLNLCRDCHQCRHEQKDRRQIGLALLVRAGRGTAETVCELYYRVTARRWPPVEEVKMLQERGDEPATDKSLAGQGELFA